MAEEDPTDLATADGRPATVEAARGRLARMVGADSEGFSQDDARELAGSADALLLDRLEAAARRACSVIGPLATIVTCGSGSSLARRVGLRMVESDRSIISLADAWGPAAAAAGCAHALLALVQEKPLEEEPEW
jgi:uncharacterized hydantoinase/oxoprolinase family protein